MTDISANQYLQMKGELFLQRWIPDNSAAQHIYKGSPMILDVSEDTLYPRIFTSAVTLAASDVFIGIAEEEVNVQTTDTEANNIVNLITGPSIVGFKSAVFTDADVGKSVYFDDSGTLTATSTANLYIGKLIRVEAGYAFVQLAAPYIQSHI